MGSTIPMELGLDFAIPLTFISILFKGLAGWPGLITIITSAIVSVLASQLPMNIGLVVAAIVGIGAGTISQKLLFKESEVSDNE